MVLKSDDIFLATVKKATGKETYISIHDCAGTKCGKALQLYLNFDRVNDAGTWQVQRKQQQTGIAELEIRV